MICNILFYHHGKRLHEQNTTIAYSLSFLVRKSLEVHTQTSSLIGKVSSLNKQTLVSKLGELGYAHNYDSKHKKTSGLTDSKWLNQELNHINP